MMIENVYKNDGENLKNIKQELESRKDWNIQKNKQSGKLGLYRVYNSTIELNMLTKTEYEIINIFKPNINDPWHGLISNKLHILYTTHDITVTNSTYSLKYIPYSQQPTYINIDGWENYKYNYTAKINMAGIIKHLRALINLSPSSISTDKVSIISILALMYYNENFLQEMAKNPSEYLKIISSTDFYHYYKIGHPTTTYKIENLL